MTENEAIKYIQSDIRILDKIIEFDKEFDPKADIIGFLERKPVYEMAISALREVQRYRQIGTIEECHKAVEKQKPIAIKEIYMTEYICPFCGSKNLNGAIGVPDYNYCPECFEELLKWLDNQQVTGNL